LSKIIQFHEGATNLRNTFKGHIFCQNTKVHVGRTFYISTNTLLLATPTLYQSFVLLATPTLYTCGSRNFCNPKNIHTWVTRPPIYSEHSLISQYLAMLGLHRDYFLYLPTPYCQTITEWPVRDSKIQIPHVWYSSQILSFNFDWKQSTVTSAAFFLFSTPFLVWRVT